jgi:mxaJ protein
MKRGVAFAFALLLTARAFAADSLRVCADPDNLPYSRADGSGFENRIAELIAAELKRPLEYAWLPDRRGFVRKTLGAQLCDVIMGVPADFERTANTRPYYRSTYVLVQRAGDAPVRSLDDPHLATMRVGVQLIGNDLAASPPGALLARLGDTQNVRGFPLAGETPSAQRAVEAIARGDIDAAVLWGPQAGYFARHASVPLRIAALHAPADAHFDFAIAMGVRRGDSALREELDEIIARRRADIARILDEYGVPRVREGTP